MVILPPGDALCAVQGGADHRQGPLVQPLAHWGVPQVKVPASYGAQLLHVRDERGVMDLPQVLLRCRWGLHVHEAVVEHVHVPQGIPYQLEPNGLVGMLRTELIPKQTIVIEEGSGTTHQEDLSVGLFLRDD